MMEAVTAMMERRAWAIAVGRLRWTLLTLAALGAGLGPAEAGPAEPSVDAASAAGDVSPIAILDDGVENLPEAATPASELARTASCW